MNRTENSVREEVNGFVRILEMSPPFDKRDPDPNKNYGIHGIDFRMVLVKENKAVQFVAFLPVYLPHVADELAERGVKDLGDGVKYHSFQTIGADVGYHSPTPTHEEQTQMESCEYIKTNGDGGCYYDGSGLRAREWCKEWLEHGNDYIFAKLEKEWEERFRHDETTT